MDSSLGNGDGSVNAWGVHHQAQHNRNVRPSTSTSSISAASHTSSSQANTPPVPENYNGETDINRCESMSHISFFGRCGAASCWMASAACRESGHAISSRCYDDRLSRLSSICCRAHPDARSTMGGDRWGISPHAWAAGRMRKLSAQFGRILCDAKFTDSQFLTLCLQFRPTLASSP